MRFLSLFAGIGGFDLGLERAGMQCAGQCEIDDFCLRVLEKHWPDVPRFKDIRTLTGDLVRERCGRIDLVCGGVPCQPASCAGKRQGAADDRWLWPDFLRVVRAAEPVWVLAENVPGLIGLKPHGLDWVCAELEDAGYECLPLLCGAEHVGAPHRRWRVWIIGRLVNANRSCDSGRQPMQGRQPDWRTFIERTGVTCSATNSRNRSAKHSDRASSLRPNRAGRSPNCSEPEFVADAASEREPESRHEDETERTSGHAWCEPCRHGATLGVGLADAEIARRERPEPARPERAGRCAAQHGWPARPGERQHEWEAARLVEFPMGGAASGLSAGLVRSARRNNKLALKAFGNSVIPQIVTAIGTTIIQCHNALNAKRC
jgi:DNA (cytosine-5)-methyltransferase 1